MEIYSGKNINGKRTENKGEFEKCRKNFFIFFICNRTACPIFFLRMITEAESERERVCLVRWIFTISLIHHRDRSQKYKIRSTF